MQYYTIYVITATVCAPPSAALRMESFRTVFFHYLQRALDSSLLIEALQDFPIDPQAQNLTGDFVIVRHCVAFYLQFGVNRHGEVWGLGVLVVRRGTGWVTLRLPRLFWLRQLFLLNISILKHVQHLGSYRGRSILQQPFRTRPLAAPHRLVQDSKGNLSKTR